MVNNLLLVDQASLAGVNLVKKLARNTCIPCWEQHLKCKMNITSYVGLFNSDSIQKYACEGLKVCMTYILLYS